MAHPGLPAQLPPDFNAAIEVLFTKQQLGVEDMKLMILLETAGEPLYQKMAELAPNEEAAELLRQNGREETAHAHRLKKAIEIQTGENYEIPPLSANPYSEAPPFEGLSKELLEGVQQGEFGGDAAYQQYAEAEPNAEIAELLRQNGREETRHGERVARVIELLGETG
jgi:rubrerythrin